LIFADNAPAHKAVKVIKYFKEKKKRILYGAPYCPENNFAELVI
jgi:transposase